MIIEVYSAYPSQPSERWKKEIESLTNPQKKRFRDLLLWTLESTPLNVEMKENLVDELILYVRKETPQP